MNGGFNSGDSMMLAMFEKAKRIHGEDARLYHEGAFRFRLEVAERRYSGTLDNICRRLLDGDVGVDIERGPCRITAMHSGAYVHYNEPMATTILLADIRYHLAEACRYNNTRKVSVLFHTALVIKLARAQGYAPLLLAICAAHDFSEAYLGEDPGGKKDAVPELKRLENAWDAQIFRRFGLPWPLSEEQHHSLKVVDHRALVVEMEIFDHPRQSYSADQHGGSATAHELDIGIGLQGIGPENLWIIVLEALEEGGATLGVEF